MRIKNKGIARVAIVGLSLLLAACGGGGGGDNGGDDGGDTQDPVTMTSVVVEGVVTGDSVANVQVVIEVAGQSFASSTDASGEYAITVSVDESFSEEMVRAEATGEDAVFKLVSLMGDLGTLVDAAGDDGILTRSEHQAVVISNLSTALTAQVEAGEPGSIATQEQFFARKKLVDGSQAFQLAVLIKLVLDYPGSPGVAMPLNTANTYELAADVESAAFLAAEISRVGRSVYQEAVEAIITDQNLLMPILEDEAALQDTFYFISPKLNTMPYESRGSAPIAHRLIVNNGGAGELSGSFGASPIDWVATAQGLEVSGAEFVVRSQSNFDSSLGAYVEEELVVQPKRINWLETSAEVDWLLVTAETFTRYPNGEYPATAPVSITDGLIAVRDAGTGDLEQVLQMGLELSIPVPRLEGEVTDPSPENPDAYLDIMSVQLSFAGNVETGGSVTVTQDSINGLGIASSTLVSTAWEIDSNGHLRIADVLGHSLELVLLESGNSQSPVLFVESNDGVDKASVTGRAYLREAPAWTETSAVGIYRYSLDFFTPLQPFWFEVNADGTALTVSTFDINDDGALSQDEIFQMPGLWQINAAGNLVIRRYRAPSGPFCEPATWDPVPSDDCVLYHEREWVVHQDGARVTLRHYHRFFMDAFFDTSTPAPAEHTLLYGTVANIYLERAQERPLPLSSM